MVAHIVSEKIHFDLQQQPEWQNFDLQHFEWQFFSGNTLYNNALNGYDSGMGGEAIFFTGRGGAGRGKAKNLRDGAGRGTSPSPQCGAGRGRGQNLRGGEHTACIS